MRALASHQCGPGLTCGPGDICGLTLLVLVLNPRGDLFLFLFIIITYNIYQVPYEEVFCYEDDVS